MSRRRDRSHLLTIVALDDMAKDLGQPRRADLVETARNSGSS
jgi:hypothetical protein